MDEFNENQNNNQNTNEGNFDAFQNNQEQVNQEPIKEEPRMEEPVKEKPKKNSDKTIIIVLIVLLVALPVVIFSIIFFGSMFISIFNQTQKVVNEAAKNEISTNTIVSNDIGDLDNNYTKDNDKKDISYKVWDLNTFKLSYNEDNWDEQKYQGYDVIKYKNMENYIGYIGENDVDVGDNLSSQEFRDGFEEQSSESLSTTDVKYLYTDWSDIDGPQHLCRMYCSSTIGDTEEEGYITYYFYFLNGKMYTFMTTEEEISTDFENEAEEILKGVHL